MVAIRISGPQVGDDLGTVSVDVGTAVGTTTVRAFKLPSVVTGLPRLNSGQYNDETASLDTTGLTGISAYDWREVGGATRGTSATLSLSGLQGQWLECAVTCDQGTLVSPPFLVHSMMNADHAADEKAVLALIKHSDATHIAVADGNWTDPATWGGAVPRNGARVLVPHGISVTYDQPGRYLLDWVRIDGRLITDLTRSTHCEFEGFVVTRGGVFHCGTGAGRLPSQYTSQWVVSDRTCRTELLEPTPLDFANDDRLILRGMISMGERRMWGAFKTPWLRSAAGSAPMTGATSVTLAQAPTGWQVGDTIVIGGTAYQASPDGVSDVSESEERVITAINGAVVSWSGGLLYDHDHRNPDVTRTDLQPAVANLNRNIKIYSKNPDVAEPLRGHTMDMHMFAWADIWDVEHFDLGRTITRQFINIFPPMGAQDGTDFNFYDDTNTYNTEPMTALSNIKSRYPIHCHFLGFNKARKDVFNGCVVRNAPSRGMVHHGCEAFFENCVVYDFGGAGMFSETGNETGDWIGSLCLRSKDKTLASPKEAESVMGAAGVNSSYGVGFFMRGRAIRCVDNFAMDASNGFVFFHRKNLGGGSRNFITEIIDHDRSTLDIKDLQGWSAFSNMAVKDYPILHFEGNESAGMSYTGFFVSKANPPQSHGWNIKLKDFKSWSWRASGAMIEYVVQYVLEDFDIIGANGGLTRGINIAQNTAQISIVRPRTERCRIGVDFQNIGDNFPDANYDINDNPKFMLVEHTSVNDDFALGDPDNLVDEYGTAPAAVEPSHNLPFRLATWDGTTNQNSGISNAATGLLTDTVSSAGPLPKPHDPLSMLVDDPDSGQAPALLAQAVAAMGYYTYNGGNWLIFPMYWADRLYGTPFKTWHGIECTGALYGGANNGAFTLSANPPVVAPVSVSVTANSSGNMLDVMALASDPDGGTLTVSDSYARPNHGRATIAAGVVDYTPDRGFTGTDAMTVWVEDGQGHATRVDIGITVT